MILPIALIYDAYGKLSRVRYIKFGSRGSLDFNYVSNFETDKHTFDKMQVIEKPIPPIEKSEYYIEVFHGAIGITQVNANNRPVSKEYTQVVFTQPSLQRYPSSESLVYAVDYKGKVFRFTVAQFIQLVRTTNIEPGNVDIVGDRLTRSSSYSRFRRFCSKASLYADALDDQTAMSPNTAFQSDDIDVTYLPDNLKALRIPEGVLNIELYGTNNKLHSLKSIFCPEVANSANLDFPYVVFETLKLPTYVFIECIISAYAIKNLILPSYILPATIGSAGLSLTLAILYGEQLALPFSITRTTEIKIKSAPNLKSITQTVSTRAEFEDTVFRYEVADCPKFESLNLYTFMSGGRESTHPTVEVSFKGSEEYTLNLNVNVARLKLFIDVDKNNPTIHIHLRDTFETAIFIGYARVTYSNYSRDAGRRITISWGGDYSVDDCSVEGNTVVYKNTKLIFDDN